MSMLIVWRVAIVDPWLICAILINQEDNTPYY